MNLNRNQRTTSDVSELPELSLNVLRYLVTIHKTTVKQLSLIFGTEDRETRYALDCLFKENLIKKTPNLLDMKSVFFEYKASQEDKIVEWLGIDNIFEILSNKHLFNRIKGNIKSTE